MTWNQLNYELQKQVINALIKSLETEEDSLMQDGIMAAINELELWSNSPIDSESSAGEEISFVARANFFNF